MGRAPLRDHAGCLGIGAERRLGLLLRTVDRGIGRRVDHAVRTQPVQQGRQCLRLVEVDLLAGAAVGQQAAARGRKHLAQRLQRTQQLLPDLAVAAEDQQPHGT